MREFKHTIGRHIFTLIIPQAIEDKFGKFKIDDYNPETSLECASCVRDEGDCCCDDYSYLYDMCSNNDEYLPCRDAMKMDGEFLQKCFDYVQNIDVESTVNDIAKKKNGTFRKGAVQYVRCSPLGYLSEEEYGYRRDCLRWKVIDDTTAELQFTSYVDKW